MDLKIYYGFDSADYIVDGIRVVEFELDGLFRTVRGAATAARAHISGNRLPVLQFHGIDIALIHAYAAADTIIGHFNGEAFYGMLDTFHGLRGQVAE